MDENAASVTEDNARAVARDPVHLRGCVPQSPHRSSSSYLLRGFGSPFLDSAPVTFLRSATECVHLRRAAGRFTRRRRGCPADTPCANLAETSPLLTKRSDLHSTITRLAKGPAMACVPVDGDLFSSLDVELLDFSRESVYRETVMCPNAEFGCLFRGELRFLEHHCLENCRFGIAASDSTQKMNARDIIRHVLRKAAESSRFPQRDIRTAKRRLLSTFDLSSSYLIRGFGSPFLDSAPRDIPAAATECVHLRRVPVDSCDVGAATLRTHLVRTLPRRRLFLTKRSDLYSRIARLAKGPAVACVPSMETLFSSLDIELLDFSRESVYRETVICPNAEFRMPVSGSSSYLLRGFGSPFLDSAPVTFLRRLPSACICAGCRSIHATSARLPCGHTLCEPCRDVAFSYQTKRPALQDHETCEGARHGLCPVDGDPFSSLDVELLDFSRESVYRETVICPNAEFGCRFRGELRFLEHHCLENCRFGIAASISMQKMNARDIIRHVLRKAAQSSRFPQRDIRTARRRLLSTFEM
ncbi:hypothetical protein MTO96_018600 [Rhipicephalus appendiculatus]